jgi:hypothetical protein|tara:strand:+ start:1689 stop:1802 length:114 start_codon:yes stop_codon:yes gene_type:complete
MNAVFSGTMLFQKNNDTYFEQGGVRLKQSITRKGFSP